jgi:hypothetical protein
MSISLVCLQVAMVPAQRWVSARLKNARATGSPLVLATAIAFAFLALLVAPLPPVAANTHAVVAGRAAEVLASVGASGPGTWHKFAAWVSVHLPAQRRAGAHRLSRLLATK